ncbi:4-chlorobenzoyl coenzyme A dehalogenase-2 [compost metagenome]
MSVLEFIKADGVATLVMSRPSCKNALNADMRDAMLDSLADIRHDPGIRAVLLTGAGDDFCAGGDVGNMSRAEGDAADARSRMAESNRIPVALAELERPVIAAVDGVAYGAGFSLALAADFIVASERARFCMAFARIGAVPDLGATFALPRVVGLQKAKELIYTAREISADEALTLGIALEVVPLADFRARATELAYAMANMSPGAYSMTKHLLTHSLSNTLDSQLDEEANSQAIAMASAYFKDATARFMRKEPLQYRWPQPLKA